MIRVAQAYKEIVDLNWRNDFEIFCDRYFSDSVDHLTNGIHHSQWHGILDNQLIQENLDDDEEVFSPSTLIHNDTGKINRKIVIQAPRDHAKSTKFTVHYAIWQMYKNPNIRIVIVSATSSGAKSFLREIKSHLETNELLLAERGSLKPDIAEKWTEDQIIVKRNIKSKDPTIAAIGAGGTILSRRCDLLILDDILNLENTQTEDQRHKIEDWWGKLLSPILVPTGQLIVVGTIFHEEDLLTKFMKDKTFHIRVRYKAVLDFDTEEVLWPERYSFEVLMEKKSTVGIVSFNLSYQNEVLDEATAMIKREWMERAKERGKQYRIFEKWNKNTNPFGPGFIVHGVDLQGSKKTDKKRKRDYFAIVTLFIRFEDGARIPLHVVREQGLTMAQQETMIEDVFDAFGGEVIFVESNGYQEMLSRDMKDNTSLPIKSFNTNSDKNDLYLGVNSLGVLLENDKFILIMRSDNMKEEENMRYLVDGLQLYSPTKHVEDTVMALWFANVAARELERKLFKPVSARIENNLFSTKTYGESNDEIRGFIQGSDQIVV